MNTDKQVKGALSPKGDILSHVKKGDNFRIWRTVLVRAWKVKLKRERISWLKNN